MSSISYWLFLLVYMTWHFPLDIDGFGINLMKVSKEDRAPYACTVGLVKKYFNSGESLSGSVVYVTSTKAAKYLQQSFIQTFHEDQQYPWTIVVKNAKVDKSTDVLLHEKPQCYFCILESIEDENIDELFAIWKSTLNWNPLAQFVVFVATVEETEEEMTDIMIEVLLMFMNKKIFNVNILGRTESTNFIYAKTVFPYHPDNNCGNRVITTETLDICDYQDGDNVEDEKEYEDEDEGDGDGDGDGNGNGNGNGKGEIESNGKVNSVGNAEDKGEHNEQEKRETEKQIHNVADTKLNEANLGKLVAERGKEEFNIENGTEGTDVLNENMDKEMKNQNRTGNIEPDIDKTLENQKHETDKERQQENGGFEKTGDSAKVMEFFKKPNIANNENFEGNGKANADELDADLPEVKEIRSHQIFDRLLESSRNNIRIEANVSKGDKTKQKTSLHDISKGWSFLGPIVRNKEMQRARKLASIALVKEAMNLPLKKYRTEKVTKTKFCRSGDSSGQNVEIIAHSNKSKNNTHPQSLPLASAGNTEEPHLYIEEMYRALFLDKFPKDLSGCPLVAAYRPWEPYIFIESEGLEDDPNANNAMYPEDATNSSKSYDEQIESNEDDDEETTVNVRLTGIEYKMVQTIGERLHMSINMQVENTNVYQLFQQLMDGDIEMVIGGIDEDPIISQYVSTTIPYHQDDLTWCVAKARRSHNLFNFMATFEVDAWLLTLLFILSASFSIRMSQLLLRVRITSFKNYFTVCLSVMGTTLSQSVHLGRLPISLKFSFGTLFFMSLMFSNVYQSFLISTLTNPKSSHQISHTEEIYENRMHVMGSVDNVRHLNKQGETFRYVREQFQMCYNIEECLQRTAIDATLAVAVSRQHSFYNPRIPRDSLYCFDRNENIYVYLVTMLLPKKFHLLHKINPVIQHIIESGHIEKWARDLDMRRKIIEAINRAHEEKFKSLTVAQIAGPFVLIGFLLMVATFVFALECLVHWGVVRHRTRLKIAKYLHRKFS